MHGVVGDIYAVLYIHVCVGLRLGADVTGSKIRCLSNCTGNSIILSMRTGRVRGEGGARANFYNNDVIGNIRV